MICWRRRIFYITYHSAVKSTTTSLLAAASNSGRWENIEMKLLLNYAKYFMFIQGRKKIFVTCSKLWIVRDNFNRCHNGGLHLWNTHPLATKSISVTPPPNTEQRKPIWNDFEFGIKMIWQLPRRSLCAGLAHLPRINLQGGLLSSTSFKNCFRQHTFQGWKREMNFISGAFDHVEQFDILSKCVFRKVVCILWLSQSAVRCVFCLWPMRSWHRSGRPDVEETWFLAGGKPSGLTSHQMPLS